ncbi:hypothetical protein [Solibacillus isronensis]|uniref:hypothetical protein n=1 Tax=Solibacillus isronensis TaxID=412383 RepID=UPI0009A892B4|nr:hypothetical protein [Solibacillus isronensis]
MKNTLLMVTEASYSLNFLVYIQNIFLNQGQTRDDLKFPYIPIKYGFREDFEMQYRELWGEISKRISEQRLDDAHIFIEDKYVFYHRLFVEQDDTLHAFNEIYKSFEVWWASFAGRFSVERSVDEKGQKIYAELSSFLLEKKVKPQKELNISIIYDECLLADLKPTPYFAILSVNDCILNYKEIIQKLELSIY